MILLTTYLLNLFDFAMTTLWVRLYGIDAEANPVGRKQNTNGGLYEQRDQDAHI